MDRCMKDIIIQNIINYGSQSHGITSVWIRIAGHFAKEIKSWFWIRKFDPGTIYCKKMITLPQLSWRDLAVKQINRKIIKFLEQWRINELSGFGKCLFWNIRKRKRAQFFSDLWKILEHGSFWREEQINNNLQKWKFSSPYKMFFHPMGFQFNLICDIIFNGLDDIFTNISSIHMAYLLRIGIDKYFAGNVILLNL